MVHLNSSLKAVRKKKNRKKKLSEKLRKLEGKEEIKEGLWGNKKNIYEK